MKRRHHFLLSALSLIMACCLASCGFIQPISLAVNGRLVDNLDVVKRNNLLYVPDSFIRDTLEMPVQWITSRPGDAGYYANKVIVLMYHELVDGPSTPHEMSIQAFEEQLRLLQEHHFNIITMEQYAAFILEGAPVPDNAVLITFDDGYESFYSLAYPVLRKYGYTATNFIIVSAVDRRSGRPKLSWEQMREMMDHGFSFYSHTYDSHRYGPVNAEQKQGPILSNPLYLEAEERPESETEYLRRIKTDLRLAEQRLQEELGQESLILAYPYGAYNPLVEQTMQELGISLSLTTKRGINTPGKQRGFRINAAAHEDDLITQLKAYQLETREASATTVALASPVLVVDDAIIPLDGAKPPRDGREGLIPLRAFCEAYGIGLTWHSREKRVELTF